MQTRSAMKGKIMQMPPNTQHPIMTEEELEKHLAKQRKGFSDAESNRASRRKANKINHKSPG
jgi:hypothetical protein